MIQVKDYFRKNLFELVDCAVATINSRFNTPGLDLACAVERLLLEGAGGQVNDALLKQITEHYKDDLNPGRLERQLLFLSDMQETEKLEVKRPSDLIDMFPGTDTARHMQEVVTLMKLLLVLPSSSCSALRQLKTYINYVCIKIEPCNCSPHSQDAY